MTRALLDGTATISAEDFVWWLEINGRAIPPLDANWIDIVQAQCPAELPARSREQLTDVIERYFVQRFALVTSTSYRDLSSKLAAIDKTAKALLEAIEIHDHGSVLAWRELEATQPADLKRDDVYPVITLLVSRAHVAAARAKQQSETNRSTFRPTKVWADFVKGLAAVFKDNGWDVKISKSRGDSEGVATPHPSRFVNFAWAALSCLPKDLREHSSSRWTLANALRPEQPKHKARSARRGAK